MTAYDFEGNDWDEITEGEKRAIVQRLVDGRDALSEDYETLMVDHDQCFAYGPTEKLRMAIVAWLDAVPATADFETIEERLIEVANEWLGR